MDNAVPSQQRAFSSADIMAEKPLGNAVTIAMQCADPILAPLWDDDSGFQA